MFGPIPILAILAVSTPVAAVAGVLVWVWRRRHAHTTRDAWIDGLIIGWLVAVGIATLTPLSRFGTLEGRPEIVLQPLERLYGAPEEYALINLLLLAPLAVLLVLRGWRPRVVRTIVICAGVSLLIELLQLFHPDRGTNVDDLLLNTIGAVGGALLGAALRLVRGTPPPRRPISWPDEGTDGGDGAARARSRTRRAGWTARRPPR